jgi:hypothetical protein
MSAAGRLSSQSDPLAVCYIAGDLVRLCGPDVALRRADFYAGMSIEMERKGGSGTAEKQASEAIVEAVTMHYAERREREARKALTLDDERKTA